MKQLWIPVWYESNLIIEKDYDYTSEYFKSLNGLFNATISYRSDSWIKNRFYSTPRQTTFMQQSAKEVYYKKTSRIIINDEDWRKFKNAALQKDRYVILYFNS